MTLDEAIKHAEEVAESQEYEGKKLEESGEKYHDEYENYCASQRFECAEEHRQLAEWLKELKQLREQTRWIPVSERLPEKYTYTLWCSLGGGVQSDYFNGEVWEDAEKYGYNVLAWMPLPEPYKVESEENNDR